MNRSDFLNQILEVKQMIQNIGGTIQSELVAEPASMREVQELERAYQIQLPDDFIYYLTNVSAEVDIQWSFDREHRLAVMESLPMFLNRFNAIYSGSLVWSLKELASKIDCNGVQKEHNKKLNNGLPILHKVPPKRDYGRYFCILAEKGGTSHGGLTEKLSPFFHAQKQEVNAYGR